MTKERVKKIRSSMNKLLYEKKVVSVVDIFQDIDILSKKDYEDWRFGRINYLERVCKGNLHKLSDTVSEIFKYAREKDLKITTTVYKKWGKGKKITLRFSKFGKESIEKRYSSSFMYKKSKKGEKTKKEKIEDTTDKKIKGENIKEQKHDNRRSRIKF